MKKLLLSILFFCGLGSSLIAQPCKETFKSVLRRDTTSGERAHAKLYGGRRPRAIGSQPQTGVTPPRRPVTRPISRSARRSQRRRREAQPEKSEQHVDKRGLENLGNTCFMNAALQALYEIEPLREFIIQWGTQLYSDPLVKELAVLFKKMRDSQEAVIDPEILIQIVWHVKDKRDQFIFPEYRQGDSHEFITFLLDKLVRDVKPEFRDRVQNFLQDSMSYTYESVYTLPPHWHVTDEPRVEKEKETFIKLSIEQSQLPHDIGRLIDTLFIPYHVELAPRRVLNYFDAVTIASLAAWNVQKKLSFEEFETLLAQYKESIEEWQYQVIRAELNEIRDSREKFRHFFDKKYDDKEAFEKILKDLMSLLKDAVREGVEKGTRFSDLPPYLLIQLKLFETLPGGQLRKIGQHVYTPMLLSIPSVYGSLSYRLKAVVIHAGSTVDSGHYHAYTRAGNQWYECNDQMVTPLTEQYIERALKKKTPYLVFYQREDITQEFINERLEELERAIVTQIAGEPEPEPLIQAEQSIDSEQMVASLEAFASELPELATRI